MTRSIESTYQIGDITLRVKEASGGQRLISREDWALLMAYINEWESRRAGEGQRTL